MKSFFKTLTAFTTAPQPELEPCQEIRDQYSPAEWKELINPTLASRATAVMVDEIERLNSNSLKVTPAQQANWDKIVENLRDRNQD